MDPTTGPEVSGPSTKDCDRAMRTLLNIIWFLFGGLWLAKSRKRIGTQATVTAASILVVLVGTASYAATSWSRTWLRSSALIPPITR